jgi:hypothetical protein
MSAELKTNLTGHFFAGQAISSGARIELQKLYNQNKVGGDFNTFIESLKAGF